MDRLSDLIERLFKISNRYKLQSEHDELIEIVRQAHQRGLDDGFTWGWNAGREQVFEALKECNPMALNDLPPNEEGPDGAPRKD